MNTQYKKIAVIGTGSAGVLALSHFLSHMPNDWQIYSIHDPKTPRIGIGESTNPSFVHALDASIDFHVLRDLKELDGTIKFATVFKNWRKDYFYHPLLGGNCAIHFNTHKLFDFVVDKFKKKFNDRFQEIKGFAEKIENKGTHAEVVVDGKIHNFNFVIQCTGFPKDYDNYNICNLPVNHALVHNIEQPGDWTYTGHRATRNGWMFEIPLTNRQSYGYLYNDTITPLQEAKEDFSKEINVPIDKLNNIEYKFKSYYAKQVFDGRIMKNGNSAIFFEPISATSLWLYDNCNRLFFDYITNTNFTKVPEYSEPTVENLNHQFKFIANQVEELICYYYHGGSNYNTKFWEHSVKITKERLKTSKSLKVLIEQFKNEKETGAPVTADWCFSANGLLKIDKNFNYNYF